MEKPFYWVELRNKEGEMRMAWVSELAALGPREPWSAGLRVPAPRGPGRADAGLIAGALGVEGGLRQAGLD